MTTADPLESSAAVPFSELDWQFAALMERLAGGARPELRLAAALVSVRRGAGDVCLDLNRAAGGSWLDLAGHRLTAPDVGAWRDALRSANEVVGGPGELKPLILEANDRLYLRRYWVYEQQLSDALRARAAQAVASFDPSQLCAGLTRLFPNGARGEINWQQVAAFAALRSGLSVISGGPGTGKTRTVVRLLALLLELKGDAGLRVAVTAPTGKAAGRLQESIRAAKTELATIAPAVAALSDEVKTIHRLLGTIPGSPYFRHHSANPLPLDVLVVDEASMVDLALMAKLVGALPSAARLVLLGDKDQLASVEAGNVLGDIGANRELNRFSPGFVRAFHAVSGVNLPERKSGAAPLGDCLVELQQSHRFGGESGIHRVSQAVNRGDVESAWLALGGKAQRGKRDLPAGEQSVGGRKLPARNQMKANLRAAVLRGYGEMVRAPDATAALARLGHFRILAAVREGPQGVGPLNALAEEILREAKLIPRAGGWYAGRQVLITANDYSAKLFNGDLGVAWTSPTGGVDVWFAGPDGAPRRVAPTRLPAHESAFALTVHKSQGSEFEEVLLILPDRVVPVVTRELVYTGLTRARRRTEVWALETVFRAAVALRTERTSGLAARLWATEDSGTG